MISGAQKIFINAIQYWTHIYVGPEDIHEEEIATAAFFFFYSILIFWFGGSYHNETHISILILRTKNIFISTTILNTSHPHFL